MLKFVGKCLEICKGIVIYILISKFCYFIFRGNKKNKNIHVSSMYIGFIYELCYLFCFYRLKLLLFVDEMFFSNFALKVLVHSYLYSRRCNSDLMKRDEKI